MLKQLLCILAAHLVFVTWCYGQPILIPEHIEVSNTRPGNHLRTLFEDSRGLIWAGSIFDLVRYDGVSVKRYGLKQKTTSYKDELVISSITEDPIGNIWCSSTTQGPLILSLGKTGFSELSIPKLKTDLPKTRKIDFDKNGNLWGITTKGELFSVSKADSTLFIWPLKNSNVIAMGFDAKGGLWYGTQNEVIYSPLPLPGNLQKINTITLHNLRGGCIDKSGAFFAQSEKLIQVLHTDSGLHTKQLTSLAPLQNNKKRFFIDLVSAPTSSYLIATTNNNPVLFIDKTTGEIQEPKIEGIKTSRFEIYCYLISTNKLIYLGTNKGFLITTVGSRAFTEYTDTALTKFRCAIAQGTDTLLLGTMGSGLLTYTKNKEGKWQKNNQLLFNPTFGLSSNIVNKIYIDKKGDLWMGANSGFYHKEKKIWRPIFESISIWGITEDDEGNFWLGANIGGLIKFNPKTGTTKKYKRVEKPETDDAINYNRVWQVKYYKGELYLGTAKGMLTFNPKTEKFTPLFSENLSQIPIWDFSLSDSLWIIPTQGRGLWAYWPKSKKLEHIDSINTELFFLEKDMFGQNWIIADKGVVRNPWPMQGKPSTFSAFDGLNTDYLSFTGIAKLGNKQLVLCGEDGFTIVDSDLVENHDVALALGHKIFISSLKYSGLQIADYLSNGSYIDLNYSKGQLLIDWAATLSLQNKQNMSCFYTLDGFEENWNTNPTGHNIIYNNLPPGKYTLKAYLGTELNNTPQHLFSITITVIPPFWLTGWFKILVSLIIFALLIYLVYGWVVRQKLKQSKLKSQIEALRSQINPHFIFNALNSIQSFIYTEKSSEANEYLAKFARLMRQILENSRVEIISIEQELNFIGLYMEMEALRFRGSVTYDLDMTPACKAKPYNIPSMIVQPIVENALKHGFDPITNKLHITVKFKVESSAIVCEVTDTGQGFSKLPDGGSDTSKKGSFGLKLVKERLITLSKIYKKEFRIVMGNIPEDKGAYVKLIIPQHD